MVKKVVFNCKEPGCKKKIEYEPIYGGGYAMTEKEKKKGTKKVYLTCDNKHTYPYDVEVRNEERQ
jgi:hypothetical protein